MALDLTKLANVHTHGSKTLARCPACAEAGGDKGGEHLFIDQQGPFTCILFPGAEGKAHRKRIFELVGDSRCRPIQTRRVAPRRVAGPLVRNVLKRLVVNPPAPPVVRGVFGTLGTGLSFPRAHEKKIDNRRAYTYTRKESVEPVPAVPKPELPPPATHARPIVPRPISRRNRTMDADSAEAVRLLEWLHAVKLPHDFELNAGEHVVDGQCFRAKLINDLTTCQNTAPFAPALDRARKVRSLYAAADSAPSEATAPVTAPQLCGVSDEQEKQHDKQQQEQAENIGRKTP